MSPDALTTIVRAQPAARKLFEWIVQTELEHDRTTVEDLIDNCGVSRRAAINLLRALAEAGFGEFKVGRKGHPSRFEWAEDPQALAERVGQIADGDGRDDDEDRKAMANGRATDDGELFATAELFSQVEAKREAPSGPRRRAPSGEVELIEHSYVLRPKLRIELKLPADLSAREAEVLGAWIKNLSFER